PVRPGECSVNFPLRRADELESTELAIQGPPGTGKTYTAPRMICELIRQGKKVGVTATGHAVIRNLLKAVADAAGESVGVKLGHKDERDGGVVAGPGVATFDNNEDALAALSSGAVNVLGGTVFLWARPEFASSVDVLFVD